MLHLLFLLLIGIPLFVLHFLPTIVALSRHARNMWWIAVINFFLSWTVLGWVVALIWAFRDEPEILPAYVPPPPRRF